MPFEIHTIELQDGSTPARQDRLLVGLQLAVSNPAGGGAGAAVAVPVGFPSPMPLNYAVFADTGQDSAWFVSARTVNGCTLNINPRLAANTLAAGTVNLLIVG